MADDQKTSVPTSIRMNETEKDMVRRHAEQNDRSAAWAIKSLIRIGYEKTYPSNTGHHQKES